MRNKNSCECLGPKSGTPHYYSQLGLADKGLTIKQLVVCMNFDFKKMTHKARLDLRYNKSISYWLTDKVSCRADSEWS